MAAPADRAAVLIELRAFTSANSAGEAFDLRCEVRETMIDFLQREHPEALPRQRQVNLREDGTPVGAPAPKSA